MICFFSEKVVYFPEIIWFGEYMKSIESMVLSRIYGRGRGVVFSAADFIDEFQDNNIDKALSELTKQGKIRRIIRGLYDYPKYSELLQQTLSPDIEQIAQSIARKFRWRIEPSGETALNLLKLSNQVPGRYIYHSDGPNRSYAIGNTTLEFKKTVLKEIGFKYLISGMIVAALKALGKNQIDENVITTLRNQIDPKMYPKILKDTKTVTVWIYDTIKQICKEER